MPLAKLVKHIVVEDTATQKKQVHTIHQPCVLLQEGTTWTVIDPESNNELIRGVSKHFLLAEIACKRLIVDKGWDPPA